MDLLLVCSSPTDGQRQEARVGGATSRHCFSSLTPASQYKVSVHAQLGDGYEGPAITVTQATRESSLHPEHQSL